MSAQFLHLLKMSIERAASEIECWEKKHILQHANREVISNLSAGERGVMYNSCQSIMWTS